MRVSAKTKRLRARPPIKRPEGFWDAYRAGKEAGYARRDDCPHDNNPPLRVAWWQGHDAAQQEERDERIAKMG